MRFSAVSIALACAAPALAQEAPPQARTIQVMGSAKVSSMPTIAVIDYWTTGEGKTSDEASNTLVARQKAITDGVGALLEGTARMTNSNLVVIAVRGQQCQISNGYNSAPQISEGACAIVGYVATIQGNIRTSLIAKAGTAVGLASRLGARDARMQGFLLADGSAAKREAVAEAIADAKHQAMAIATAAGERLGPILAIRDQDYGANDIGIIGLRAPAPPPPPQVSQAVEIAVKPQPIDTTAQIYVTFALGS